MKCNRRNIIINILFVTLYFASCKKFVKIDAPVTSIAGDNVYTTDYSAISVLTGIYIQMSDGSAEYGMTSLSWLAELCADNLTLFDLSNESSLPYYQNELTAQILGFNHPPEYWERFYKNIYTVNAAIEGITASNTLTPAVKSRLLGEAMFMRAFCYFYLVNLYGDVPLVTSTNYKENYRMSRTDKALVYQQMITDLKAAQSLLTDDYQDITLLNKTTERIRPNKAAATALLSRVYLFTKDYPSAEEQASLLIDNNPRYKLTDLDNAFKMNSDETIWSLQPVLNGQNTWEAIQFILPSTGPIFTSGYLSEQLMNSFEDGDQRLNTWIGNVAANGKVYYYPAKYKAGPNTNVSEYEIVLRLAEQYLVRAEARAQQNKLTGLNSASADLNAIRNRAGLSPTTATTQPGLLDAILEERQHELYTEWGHRWFDLKRTRKIDEVMNIVCPLKGGVWQSYKALFPIPQKEIEANPGITNQQNPGYGN